MVLRRALWVLPVSDLGGVARHALDVARAGIPGWQVTFLAPPGPVVAELRALGSEVIEAGFGPAHGVRESVASLRSAIRRTQAEVVHSHLSYADVIVALAAPRDTLRVTTEHGIADDDLVYHGSAAKARVKALMHTARLRRFDLVLAVSAATADVMRRKWHASGREITVLHNGVDAPGTVNPQPGLRILSLARLAPEKRLDKLVDAFATLHREHPEATLTLAGSGELRADLEAQTERLGLADAVRLPGYVDAIEAMAQADVLAQLSVYENCSYSLLDAVVHGLGVVASPVGGNPEILPANTLVEPADTDAVARLMQVQGLDLAARPSLPAQWPSTSEMAAAVGAAYDASMNGAAR